MPKSTGIWIWIGLAPVAPVVNGVWARGQQGAGPVARPNRDRASSTPAFVRGFMLARPRRKQS